MRKQTAVEWLEEKLWKLDDQNYTLPQSLVEQIDQAKAIEKEQIIEAYNTGELHCVTDPRTSLDYYQHHYGS